MCRGAFTIVAELHDGPYYSQVKGCGLSGQNPGLDDGPHVYLVLWLHRLYCKTSVRTVLSQGVTASTWADAMTQTECRVVAVLGLSQC